MRIKQSFETTCFISFAAPYSLSETVTLPVGLILSVSEYPDREEPYRFEAGPVNAKEWAAYLVPSQHRRDKNFRYGYYFCLKQAEVEQHCELLTDVPAELPTQLKFHNALQGSLLGTAVADAIGLPFEGMSPRRIKKLKAFPLRQRFFFGRGMLSDDTEHSCIVAHALIFSVGEVERFAGELAWSLRLWLLGLPAGIGMATLKACLRLWMFKHPDKSGVFSAGNGPAMRCALLGVYAHDDAELRKKLVSINTRITHTDPKAYRGALIVAELAACNVLDQGMTTENCLQVLGDILAEDEELKVLIETAIDSAKINESAEEYCQRHNQAKGVSGYIYHTIPVVVQIVLRHNNDYKQAITEAIACGGDTDTVAAIVGGIVGARVGTAGIPAAWLENLKDWPRNNKYLYSICEELVAVKHFKKPGTTQWMDPIRLWMRNIFFMVWVLAHGFRRILPPY